MASIGIDEAQRRIEAFLTGQMVQALRSIDYELADFGAPGPRRLAEAARADIAIRHVPGAADCTYRIRAFGESLEVQIQLNVNRFVVVYRLPALNQLDAAGLVPRLERWRIGAEHAGWKIGWRDAIGTDNPQHRFVETYCYAFAQPDLLENELEQLFWRTDIVQMTRYFMLEMKRYGIPLSG